MLGEMDLKPKIVENSQNKRFDVLNHVHPEQQTNVFRRKKIEIPEQTNELSPKWKNFFNKNNNKENPEADSKN